jgi:phage/plasmid-like protein (TIGR03299 family)
MSKESMPWLNVMTLIGNTAARSVKDGWHRTKKIVTADAGLATVVAAWHYRAALQGDEPNHYAGFIPVEDVVRRLFSWKPVIGDFSSTGTAITPEGVHTFTITDANRVTTLRPPGSLGPDDPGAILGAFKKGYKIHDFELWLLTNIATILDDSDLGISAAGLLGEGARAWVEVSIPESMKTPEGVEYRPNLLAPTSLDGSIATGYACTAQVSICDNTLSIARREKGRKIKFKHTTNSLSRLGEARERLEIEIGTAGEDFAAQVAELSNTTVTDSVWEAFKNAHPLTTRVDDQGQPKAGRSLTYANNRREELDGLYNDDPRCAPWRGTAFGVLQTVNTHAHHVGVVKGMSRPLRNMERAISGGVDKLDAETMATLDKVLA